jgi:hypothetical protein
MLSWGSIPHAPAKYLVHIKKILKTLRKHSVIRRNALDKIGHPSLAK